MEKTSAWTLVYDRFVPAEEGLRESLCSLGNGYFGTRGSAPESMASKIHYPGTYLAGGYNRLKTHVSGRAIINEDFVNCPNWTFLVFKIGDGDWFYPSKSRILFYRQELDIKHGVLKRKLRFKTEEGLKTTVETTRIVNMDDCHMAAMTYKITPENYSDFVTVRSMLDGTVINSGVERYRQLNSKHLKSKALGHFKKNCIYLSMQTSQSKINISQVAQVRAFIGTREIRPSIRYLVKGKERIGMEFKIHAREKKTYEIEKIISFYTSRDKNIKDPLKAAISRFDKSTRFKTLLSSHQQAWIKLWDKFDIKVEGHEFSQKALRLHIFHLLQTASPHNVNIDAGLPARGLNGEAYRGHIFWDEMYVMSFYDFHDPDISKALLLYRYRRLFKARQYAKDNGYKGAMFPWQSGSSGREETQILHLNPLSGKWGVDHSRIQRHVNFAIAYNIWEHWKRVGDLGFLVRYGAEMLLSIAQFCSSLAKYNPSEGKFHTRGIMGPDEFHEKFPGAKQAGLKDNAYSNFMVVWVLLKAQELLSTLPEGHKKRIIKKIKLDHKELIRWDKIIHKMNINISNEGIIEQFDGYFKLKELDWAGYRAEYGDIHRLDRILKAEGKSPDEYKLSKQADLLMMFYLFSLEEVQSIFRRLGYSCDKDMLRKNYQYYLKRTSHGSTLSKVVHCFIAHRLHRPKESWKMFQEVLKSDISDVQGGTTVEGIHAGVMGGSIDIVIRGISGIEFFDDKIKVDPNLPKQWQSVKFKLLYRGMWISLNLTRKEIEICINGDTVLPIELNNKLYYPLLDKTLKIPIKQKKSKKTKKYKKN